SASLRSCWTSRSNCFSSSSCALFARKRPTPRTATTRRELSRMRQKRALLRMRKAGPTPELSAPASGTRNGGSRSPGRDPGAGAGEDPGDGRDGEREDDRERGGEAEGDERHDEGEYARQGRLEQGLHVGRARDQPAARRERAEQPHPEEQGRRRGAELG